MTIAGDKPWWKDRPPKDFIPLEPFQVLEVLDKYCVAYNIRIPKPGSIANSPDECWGFTYQKNISVPKEIYYSIRIHRLKLALMIEHIIEAGRVCVKCHGVIHQSAIVEVIGNNPVKRKRYHPRCFNSLTSDVKMQFLCQDGERAVYTYDNKLCSYCCVGVAMYPLAMPNVCTACAERGVKR